MRGGRVPGRRPYNRPGIETQAGVRYLAGIGLAERALALPISGTRAAVAPAGEHAVLAAVVDACPTGVLVVERDGRLVQANPSARKLLGLDANRLLVAYSTDYLQLGARLRQRGASCEAVPPFV